MDASLRGVFKPGSPAWTDFKKMVARFQLELFEAILELAKRRGAERFIRIMINALCVTGRLGIEKTQEEYGINIVVSADGVLVCVDLSKNQRLDKSPRCDNRVEITHRGPEFEGTQHVAFDIYVAGEIGIADPAFVDTLDRTQTVAVLDRYTEARRIGPEAPDGFIG